MIYRHADVRGRRRCLRAGIGFGVLFLAACIGAVSATLTFAAVQDSRFEFSADGTDVDFQVKEVPRREVLERLLTGTSIELKWLNSSFADEAITGDFRGSRVAIARELLSAANFVIGYDSKSRPAQIVIVGPAGKDPNPAVLKALTTAIAQATGQGPVATPAPGVAIPEMVPSSDFPPLPVPGAATAVAPVPTSPASRSK